MPRVNVRKGDSFFSISKRLYGTDRFAEIIRNQASRQGITKLERGQSFGLQIDTKRLKGGGKQFLRLLGESGGSATGVPTATEAAPAEAAEVPTFPEDQISPLTGPLEERGTPRTPSAFGSIEEAQQRGTPSGVVSTQPTPTTNDRSFPERLLRGAEDLSTGIAGAIGGAFRGNFGTPQGAISPQGGVRTASPSQPAPTQTPTQTPTKPGLESFFGGMLLQDPKAWEALNNSIIDNYNAGTPSPTIDRTHAKYLTLQDPELPFELISKGYVFQEDGSYVYDPTFDLARQETNFDFRGAAGGVTGRRTGRGSRSRGRAGTSKSFVPSLGGLVNWRINFGS